MREEQAAAQAHAVSLEARRRAVISGVQAVDSFNEQMVTLITGEGALTILGDNLHVASHAGGRAAAGGGRHIGAGV